MIQSLGRRLKLIFYRGPEEVDGELPVDAGTTVLHPMVDFVAYAEDCTLSGRTRLEADRLTDMLNEHDEVQLVDVLFQSLADRASVEVREVVVPRDDLLLVHATGPRGDMTRRTRTRQTYVSIETGPFGVRGFLHAAPFIDAISALGRRGPMVPLTDAVVDFRIEDEWHRHRVGTLIVNRHAIDRINEATEGEPAFPDPRFADLDHDAVVDGAPLPIPAGPGVADAREVRSSS
ncbi:MAG TPA: hypothetical protein VIB02_03000 [Candidatus Limnocylindrales bacterium]|jgi:hypothetical protein